MRLKFDVAYSGGSILRASSMVNAARSHLGILFFCSLVEDNWGAGCFCMGGTMIIAYRSMGGTRRNIT